MASADYSVGTKVTADVSNFEKGMNKAEKSLKGFSDKLANSIDRLGKKGLVGSVANVTLAMQGLTKSFSTVIKFAKDVGKAINECTEAYKGQVIAERALDTAIQNNPFVTGESSKTLKEFASDMQRVSNYGDEELIPMMANLISLGRTESETMQIMSVAMDMSAGMGISLDSAITQLNATLNGSIGRLGQQNKELKGLTEEELKQGKAIDILGKKFKGFASATADTSKQLKIIKGDFKEALGQFTLPSSDMWNRFWAGFYQSGIDVINRFNDYLDTQIIGKKIIDNLRSNARTVSNATGNTVEEVLSDLRYLKEQINYLSDSELSTLQKTLEKQNDRSEAEERMLTIVKEITNSRKLNLEYEKELAEKEAKTAQALIEQEEIENGIAELKAKHLEKIREQKAKWENIEKVMGKAVSLEEKLKFYQDDLVAIMTEAGGQISTNNEYYKKQSAIINEILSKLGQTVGESEWQKKLFDQRLEMLETERDRAMQLAEEEGQETYSIWFDYNNKILDLKLERLENEKEKALAEEGLTAEDKIKVEEYYKNETQKIYNELGNYKKKNNEEEKKDEKSKFTKMLEMVKQYSENVKKVFSKIASTIKNVFSAIGNIFKKALDIFNFNPDEALTSLLKVEDAILTFFVETVPKLPAFFKSAIESIIKLINSLMATIDFEGIQNFIYSIIDTIIENAPKIINQLLEVVINIAQSLLNGIFHFVENGGWQMFLNTLLNIQNKIQDFVINNIDKIVQTIIDMLPDLVQFLIDSVVSASQTLSKLIRPIVKLIVPLIEAIIDFLASDEIMDAFIDVVLSLVDAIVEELIPAIIKKLPKILTKIIKFIVSSSVKMTSAIVQGLVNAFVKTNWGEVIKQCFIGFIEAFKDLFGIHSPSTLFENFGQFMIEGLWKGIQDMGNWLNDKMGTFFLNMVSGVGNAFANIGEGIKGAFENVWANIQSVFNNVGNWFYNIFSQASNGIRNAFNGIGEWFRSLWEGFANAMKTPINKVISGINEMITQMNKISVTIPSWVPAIGGRTFGINLSKLNYLANGTNNAEKGLAIVGEAGPELVKFNGGEQVLNNRNTNKALAEAGKSTNNFNVTFNNLQDTTAYAMMQQLKQYNRQMAINGVI